MKLMKTEEAVGQVLCHDITQIIKGVTKDAVFRKGHVIKEEDIPVLLSVGKDHIYIHLHNKLDLQMVTFYHVESLDTSNLYLILNPYL